MEKREGGRDGSGREGREEGRDRGWRRGREGEMGVGGKVERKEGIGGGEEGGEQKGRMKTCTVEQTHTLCKNTVTPISVYVHSRQTSAMRCVQWPPQHQMVQFN